MHWNGTVWSDSGALTAGTSISALWGSAANDVWAVSGAYEMVSAYYVGTTLHYDGSAWSAARTARRSEGFRRFRTAGGVAARPTMSRARANATISPDLLRLAPSRPCGATS